MRITIQQVCRDYLALRGESPDLIPELEEGEDSAVLTLRDELLARLEAEAVRATLETPRAFLDEIITAPAQAIATDSAGYLKIPLPDDYLRLYSLRMADWKEPVYDTEPADSLRWILGANAPKWMICRHRPMAGEDREAGVRILKVYGSEATGVRAYTLLYVPRPQLDGEELAISRAAYYKMMKNITE